MNKLRTDNSDYQQPSGAKTSKMYSLRRSRDLREELIQQRIATSARMEAMNIRVPQTWKAKEEAFTRFKQMKESMLHRGGGMGDQ